MQAFLRYRTYIRAIFLSILAACCIDAAVNFDDVQRSFEAGRHHVGVLERSASLFKLSQHVATVSGVFYSTLFDQPASR